jgi:hypothetical protein
LSRRIALEDELSRNSVAQRADFSRAETRFLDQAAATRSPLILDSLFAQIIYRSGDAADVKLRTNMQS